MSTGKLEVIVGCMSSGKSEELIRRLKRAVIAKQDVCVFKPAFDTRSTTNEIASRNGYRWTAVSVDDADDITLSDGTAQTVVGIDEGHFFSHALIATISALLEHGHRVIVAGLDTDFRGDPFPIMAHLMAIADEVTRVTAICIQCGENATRTQRLVHGQPAPADSPILQVGGDDMYEARCRACHVVPKTDS